MGISYLIAVHNEHEELKRLLDQLFHYLDADDEIIIQGDQGKVTDEVVSVIRSRLKDKRVKYVEFPLNKDFSTFKNNLLNQATKEYCFLIDADELLHPNLISNVKALIESNFDIEMFVLPRFNVVKELTQEYAKSQNWNVQTFLITDEITKTILNKYNCISGNLVPNVVNFSDSQERLWLNKKEIRYRGKVHERLSGYGTYTILPTDYNPEKTEFDLSWCIFHVKDFERQQKQNQFYSTLNA